jgi:hypothetical protein
MELAAAILCDHVSVREGLLIVVGGGITRLWRENLPAPLNVELALLLEMSSMELGGSHEVAVIDEDGGEVARFQGGLQVGARDLDPGETQLVPLAVKFGPTGVSHHGRYSMEISLDGRHVQSVGFRVLPRNLRQ